MNYFQPIDSGIFFANSLVCHEKTRQKKNHFAPQMDCHHCDLLSHPSWQGEGG